MAELRGPAGWGPGRGLLAPLQPRRSCQGQLHQDSDKETCQELRHGTGMQKGLFPKHTNYIRLILTTILILFSSMGLQCKKK